MNTASALLTDEQAGDVLHVHARTLANWAYLGIGPAYVLAAAVKLTVVTVENLTVGSARGCRLRA